VKFKGGARRTKNNRCDMQQQQQPFERQKENQKLRGWFNPSSREEVGVGDGVEFIGINKV